MSWFANYKARAQTTLAPPCEAEAERLAFEEEERAAMLAVPPWPLPGTPERANIERAQAQMVAGLLATADPQRWNTNRP